MYPRPAQGRIRQWRIPLGAQADIFAMIPYITLHLVVYEILVFIRLPKIFFF